MLLLSSGMLQLFNSVQSLSRVQLFAIPWTTARQASCPSPTPRACSNSCPSSQWCYLILCLPLSPCLQSFPASGSSPKSQCFISCGQSTGASASTSALPMNTQNWDQDGLIWSPFSPRDSKESSPTSQFKSINSLALSAFFTVQLSHSYMTTGKTIALTRQTFVCKVMSLLFNMLSRLVITFLPRSKRLLILWLQSPSGVILEPQKIKSATVSTVSPSIWHEVMGLDAMILVFWMLSFRPLIGPLTRHSLATSKTQASPDWVRTIRLYLLR